MPLTGDSQVNKKAFGIAINSRKVVRFHPLDREKTVFDERVDLLKLSVTIRMLAALACFGVRLQAETHLAQQASNNLITNLKSFHGQGVSQMPPALAHP